MSLFQKFIAFITFLKDLDEGNWPQEEPAGLDDPHDPQQITRVAYDDDFPQLERIRHEKMH